jgi:hypothetical protein
MLRIAVHSPLWAGDRNSWDAVERVPTSEDNLIRVIRVIRPYPRASGSAEAEEPVLS